MKIFLPLVAILLCFSVVAASIVAWFPQIAERISRLVVGWWSPVILAILFLWGIPKLPALWQQSAKLLTLAAVLVTIPVCFGILFFPTETRNADDLKPAPTLRESTTLLTRLREPWSSMAAGRLPAVVDLVRCADAVYQPPEQLRESVAELGFADHVLVVNGPSKGVVMIKDAEAVVAFEGTNGLDDIGDWFANLETSHAWIAEGTVHGGFLRHYNRVADQVRNVLEKNAVSHVWVTGHSLGGAMAVLCAADIARRGNVVVRGVITFGQPLLLVPACARVVNETLAGRHLRFINEADVVPCVAPGFRGGGSFVWFQDGKPTFGSPTMRARAADDGSFVQADEEGGPTPLTESEFKKKKKEVKAQIAPPQPGEPVKAQAMPSTTDHNMQRYVEAVLAHYGSAAGDHSQQTSFRQASALEP